MSGHQRSAQPRDFHFVNFSSPTDMHDADSKAQIRKHAMKVSGLARRRTRRQHDDLIEVQLQIWPNEPPPEPEEEANEANALPLTDFRTTMDNVPLTSEDVALALRQRSAFGPSKSHPSLAMQSCDIYDMEPHWVFDYAIHLATSICILDDTSPLAALPTNFFQDPLIFHASRWCAAVICNLLTKTTLWTSSQEALTHKAEAMRLVRQRLQRLDEIDVEWVIYAVLCLARTDSSKKSSASDVSSQPLVAHLPCANWTNLYGKTELADEHRHALCHLVNRQGGLHQLQLPGLSLGLALSDLQAASTTYSTPMFPKFWSTEVPHLHSSWTLPVLVSPSVGQGFLLNKDAALTKEAALIFTNLSVVDRILSHHGLHWAKGMASTPLLNARNAAHYDLLCLPSWHALDSTFKARSHPVYYELCRLTCILYSNAVLMGLPPDTGWYARIIASLISVLDLLNIEQEERMSDMVVWSLFIACIAAYDLPERTFFQQRLEQVISRNEVQQWNVLHGILQEFLWSDAACEMKAKDLWKCLNVES